MKLSFLVVALLLIVALFLLLLFIPSFINLDNYRVQIQSQLQQRLGYRVEIGRLGMSLIPRLGIRADQVTVYDKAEQHLAGLDAIHCYLKVLPLLQGEIHITSLLLEKPELTIRLDTQSEGQKPAQAPSRPVSKTGGGVASLAAAATVADLRVRGGRVVLEGTDLGRLTLNLERGTLRRPAADEPVHISLTGGLQEFDMPFALEFEAEAPDSLFDFAMTPLTLSIRLEGSALEKLEALLAPFELGEFGKSSYVFVLDANGTIAKGIQGNGRIDVDSRVEPAFLRQVQFTMSTAPFLQRVTLASLNLHGDDLEAQATGVVENPLGKPAFDFEFSLPEAHATTIAALSPVIGLSEVGEGLIAGSVTGKGSLKGEGDRLLIRADGEIKDVTFRSPLLTLPLEEVGGRFSLKGERLVMDPARFRIGTNRLSGTVTVDTWTPPRLHVAFSSTELDVSELLSVVTGNASEISLLAPPSPQAEAYRTPPPLSHLVYAAEEGNDETLRLVIPREVRNLLADGSLDADKGRFESIRFESLSSNFRLRQGVLSLNPLSFRFSEARQRSTGEIDLTRDPITLDLQFALNDANGSALSQLADFFGWSRFGKMVQGGRLNCEGHLKGTWLSPDVGAAGTAEGFTLRPPLLALPLEDVDAQFVFQGGRLSSNPVRFRIGSSRLEGSAEAVSLIPPRLHLSFSSRDLNVTELLAAFTGSPDITAELHPEADGPWPHRRSEISEPGGLLHDLASLLLPSLSIVYAAEVAPAAERTGETVPLRIEDVIADGTIEADHGRFEGMEFDSLAAPFRMQDGRLSVDPITFQFYGGTHRSSGEVDFTQAAPSFKLNTRIANAEINPLLSQATRFRDLLYGFLSTEVQVEGSGLGKADLLSGLTAQGKFSLRDGQLANLNLFGSINQLRALLGKDQISAKNTRFSRFEGQFAMSQGTIRTEDLRLSATDLDVTGAGSVALDGTIRFQALATLSEELTAQVGASAIPTLFFKEGNRAVIPLVIRGTAFQPSVALDTDYLAKKITETPKQKIEEEIKDAVKGIFDKLLKKKEKENEEEPPESR